MAASLERPVPTAGALLRSLRDRRRVSQLELALRAGGSQRHLSCVDTGRAGASREMLLALLGALDAPLGDRNEVLLAAGFAPAYGRRALQHADLRALTGPGEPRGEARTPLGSTDLRFQTLDGRLDVEARRLHVALGREDVERVCVPDRAG